MSKSGDKVSDTMETPCENAADEDARANADGHDPERRAALLKMSAYAAAVAPAMLVLTRGTANALPDCDNPAWNVGLNRTGHSGC